MRNATELPVAAERRAKRKIIAAYDAQAEGKRAYIQRRKKRRPCKLHAASELWKGVKVLLQTAWSPEQIALKSTNCPSDVCRAEFLAACALIKSRLSMADKPKRKGAAC